MTMLARSAAVATIVPAWRATRVDLARGLQAE
jgi:hypothetical protein